LVTPAEEKKPFRDGIESMVSTVLKVFTDSQLPDKSVCADPHVSPVMGDLQSYPGTVAIMSCEGSTTAWLLRNWR
jgi:hypothetical protein